MLLCYLTPAGAVGQKAAKLPLFFSWTASFCSARAQRAPVCRRHSVTGTYLLLMATVNQWIPFLAAAEVLATC